MLQIFIMQIEISSCLKTYKWYLLQTFNFHTLVAMQYLKKLLTDKNLIAIIQRLLKFLGSGSGAVVLPLQLKFHQ